MRGIAFELTFDEYLKYYQKPCYYCDMLSIGLDRICSVSSYNIKNIIPCCPICNMMKASIEREAFLTHCERIALKHSKNDIVISSSIITKTDETADHKEICEETHEEAKNKFNRRYWLDLFEKTGGNITEMSRLSQRYRADVYKILKKYGLFNKINNRKIETLLTR